MLVIMMFAGALACDVSGFCFCQFDRPLFVMEAGHELGFCDPGSQVRKTRQEPRRSSKKT